MDKTRRRKVIFLFTEAVREALELVVNLRTLVDEQRAIASYLDRKCAAIDRVVAEKEGLIADLEQYKKSLIFECVTGKREVA